MLKIMFWGLLMANGALFAFDRGALDAVIDDGHEPARMRNQLNADKIMLSTVTVTVTPPAPVIATPPPVVPTLPEVVAPAPIACTEIGIFDLAEAKRFETLLGAGTRLTRRGIKEPERHMVYIPSQGDKNAADKKAAELKRLGLTDFYIIQDDTDLRWGISLGIFKTEEGARTHLANLAAKGVRSARLGLHSGTANRVALQLRGMDDDLESKLNKIKQDFPRQDLRRCDVG